MLELKCASELKKSLVNGLIIVQCLNWNAVFVDRTLAKKVLIIVQCLNWNGGINKIAFSYCSYNRTMLELKFVYFSYSVIFKNPYNRTMLELKYVFPYERTSRWKLIIVQCLNWNWRRMSFQYRTGELIIVQCLNWNSLHVIIKYSGGSYNRTMLELKFINDRC